MSPVEDGFGFYGLLNEPAVGHERLARLMVERGVAFIQLRMKDAPEAQLLAVAGRLREIVRPPSRLVVNDLPRVAAAVAADGVHLGQEDADIDAARAILGPGAIVGLSTHNQEQVLSACARGADYIGIGPVFPTATKARPDPVLGLEGLRRLIGLASVPAVAIGGIDLDNAARVLAAGARNICAVGCINASSDPAAALDRMLRIVEQARLDPA
ncbi:MAG: thiamine phosphate synthase [Deltaproteobacteria bacterium]|nr:thiamine phosphate synthase [Deltaproteobacteria bacterium]